MARKAMTKKTHARSARAHARPMARTTTARRAKGSSSRSTDMVGLSRARRPAAKATASRGRRAISARSRKAA